MAAMVKCPNCAKEHRLRDGQSGSSLQFTCKQCGQTVTAPIATDVTPVPAPPESPSPEDSSRADAAPAKIGPYLIRGRLGCGGMAEVWLGHDPRLQRDVAIKTLRPEYSQNPQYRDRFFSEARLAARLHHTNTVTIYEVDTDGALAYIAMELVQGRSLYQVVSEGGRMPWREATQAIRDAAVGLGVAHEAGLVHRDIKPSNLMQTSKGVTKVADFGLARAQSSDSHLTRQGAIIGTPAYLAPECWSGQRADVRSDLYSLVCTYFYLLTGQTPYDAEEWRVLGYQHQYQPVPEPRQAAPESPDQVCRILLQGMAKEPDRRYQTAAELQADLDKLLSSPEATLPHGTAWERLGGTLDELSVRPNDETLTKAKPGWTQRLSRLKTMARPAVVTVGRHLRTPWGKAVAGLCVLSLLLLSGVVYVVSQRFTVRRGREEPVRVSSVPRAEVAATAGPVPTPAPPVPAVYSVTVQPAGATLTCSGDGVRAEGIGVTRTVTIAGPDGVTQFPVRAEMAGYEPQEQRIIPKRGETGRLTFRLVPLPAELTVTLHPPTANLTATGCLASVEGQGATRRVTIREPNGQAQVQLRADLAGYEVQEQAVTPNPGEASQLSLRLKPKPAVLTVTVEPETATLTVTGLTATVEGQGATRLITVADPDGESRMLLRATLDGHEPAVQEVQPQPAESRQLSLRLTLLQQFSNSIGMKLVLIPAGEFLMGSPTEELLPDYEGLAVFFGPDPVTEKPQHVVRITKPFYLGVTEATQEQYEHVMGKNPSEHMGDPQRPVETVSWEDALSFCRKLSEIEGRTYRLPTEAEWEYACRAGSKTKYSFGDDASALGEYAWYQDNSSFATQAVAQKKANAWGLYDIHGNVWEWCQDWYGEYSAKAVSDPQVAKDPRWRAQREADFRQLEAELRDLMEGPSHTTPQSKITTGITTGGRVIRGGSSKDAFWLCRSACRLECDAGWQQFSGFRVGIRVAAVPEAKSTSFPVPGSSLAEPGAQAEGRQGGSVGR